MICPFCSNDIGERLNVFGTMCTKCNRYIPPLQEPAFVIDGKKKLKGNQEAIRAFIKKKFIGEENGNQVK